jgi:hypothetical protein
MTARYPQLHHNYYQQSPAELEKSNDSLVLRNHVFTLTTSRCRSRHRRGRRSDGRYCFHMLWLGLRRRSVVRFRQPSGGEHLTVVGGEETRLSRCIDSGPPAYLSVLTERAMINYERDAPSSISSIWVITSSSLKEISFYSSAYPHQDSVSDPMN